MQDQIVLDQLRPSDIEALKPLVGQESRKTVFEREIAPGLKLRKQQVVDEIFDFGTGEGEFFRFNVRKIKDAIVAKQLSTWVFTAPIPESLYNHILANNGVEEKRLEKINDDDIKRPAILVLFPDGRSSVIDGNHRICAAWRKGIREYRFIEVAVEEVVKGGMAKFDTKPLDDNWLNGGKETDYNGA